MTTPFWTNEPTILFNKEYIFEMWPTSDMCYERKLNAITRLIILITILGYIFTMSKRVLVVGFITLIVIFVLFKMKKQKITKSMINEGFNNKQNSKKKVEVDNSSSYVNPVTLESVLKSDYKEGTKKNPFSNVLLTQIEDDPDRKSAPPSFNVDVDEDITKNVKRAVQMMNPGIKNTNKQLYGDIYQNFELDQSNRAFFSTANTRVTNDQGAYGKFLYGDMPSSKESNFAAAIQREKDSYRYTLY
jgi:ABC-type multidrug transport system fused ATPase/permease subunit